VSGGYISPANYWQTGQKYLFHSYFGELYVFDTRTNKLFTYNDGFFNQIDFRTNSLEIWANWFFDEWFCYCVKENEDVYSTSTCFFNLRTYETTTIIKHEFVRAIPNENNDLVVGGVLPYEYGFWLFSHNIIAPEKIGGDKYRDERSVGETVYYCEYDASYSGTVGKYDDSEGEITAIEGREKYTGEYYFYRLEDGRLLVFDMSDLHRNSFSEMHRNSFIWIIDTDGDVYPILQIDGEIVRISYNICGEYIYYSFYRYEFAGDDLFDISKKFKNDKMEGTWKMNINTLETVKISNRIYRNIYVLDNNVIGVSESGAIRIIDP